MCSATQSCSMLCNSIDCSPAGSPIHGIFPGKNTYHFLLQGVFSAQRLNPQFSCLLYWQVESLPLVPSRQCDFCLQTITNINFYAPMWFPKASNWSWLKESSCIVSVLRTQMLVFHLSNCLFLSLVVNSVNDQKAWSQI